jgi:hypothetical protein
MLTIIKSLSPIAFLFALYSACLGAASTPAVNSPMLSMAGGTAPSTIYVPTASQTIASTSDVSCFSSTGQGPGATIAANGAYVGNAYRLHCSGVYTTPIGNTATLTAKIKWAATTIATATTGALPVSATNLPFWFDAFCVIQTIGATGTIVCWGNLTYSTALIGVAALSNILQTTSAITIDTTASSKIDATAAWSTTAGGQTATAIEGNIEILF